jgi:MFS family permease
MLPMEKNKRYYAYKLFKDTIPIYPVYLLLFESKGLSLGQVSLLLATWSVPVVLLEIPTGILADHWSRKNMIVAGSICKAACYVFWFFSEGFLLYAVGFIFWGISEALCSGSEEALLYDSLKQRQEEDRFDRVYGMGNFCSGLGVALSCFAGGALTEAITFRGVLAASTLMALISTVFALGLKEVNYYRDGMAVRMKEDRPKPLATLADSLELCVRNRLLMLVILMLVVVAGVAGILDEYDSLVADSFELRLGLIGVWMGARYILEAVGAKVAGGIKSALYKMSIRDPFHTVFTLCAASGICLAVFGVTHNFMLIPLYGLFYMLMAAAAVLQEEYVQNTIEEQGRSTVHSVISLVHNLYGTLFFVAVSAVSGLGIQAVLILSGVYIVCLSLLLFFWYRAVKGRIILQ